MNRLQRLFDGQLPRLAMFDLDGTLMDSVPDLAAAVDRMLMLLGREPAGIGRVRDWVGNGSRVLVRRALAGHYEHAASARTRPTRRWRCSCRPTPVHMN